MPVSTKTWSTGAILPASDLNTYVRDAVALLREAAIEAVLDGGGAPLTDGTVVYIEVPWDCTIVSFTVLADQSGSITVEVHSDTYANFPPTTADDISNGGLALSTAVKGQDETLTSWTTSLSKGDVIAFYVDGLATNIERVTCSLKVQR